MPAFHVHETVTPEAMRKTFESSAMIPREWMSVVLQNHLDSRTLLKTRGNASQQQGKKDE